MRQKLTTVLEVVGISTAAVGFGLAWLPLGLIAAGVGMVLVGYLAGRS